LILVDTGAFYALADRSDRNHPVAAACLAQLDDTLVTHALIAAETWYMLESRLGRRVARLFAEQLSLGRVEMLEVGAADVAAALSIEQRYEDLSLGLTDAVSMALCDRERVTTVFTFDRKDFGSFRPKHASSLRLLPG
jgi:hypothetical protein